MGKPVAVDGDTKAEVSKAKHSSDGNQSGSLATCESNRC